MNSTAMQQHTPAEQDFLLQFKNLKSCLPGSGKIRKLRENALMSFEKRGFPHRRLESWHYTDLRSKLKSVLPVAPNNGSNVDASKGASGIDTTLLVANNGQFKAVAADSESLNGKVSVVPLSEYLESEQGANLLSESVDESLKESLIDLNTAFMAEGVVVKIADNVVLDKPLELVHLSGSESVSSFPRHILHIGKNSKATIIENHAHLGSEANQTNCVIEVRQEENSELNWIKIQNENAISTHIGTMTAEIAENAVLEHFTFNRGSCLDRTQLFVKFTGPGAKANLRGVSLIGGSDHSDITLHVDHAVPNCESSEYYKMVVDGEGQGVFQGKVVVQPDAQKTDGRMMVQSLLLSDSATMSSKPELEIFADDVQCGHGSTTGQIDEDLLFYLRSRGIQEQQARSMLILAFLSEVIEQIGNDSIVEILERHTQEWLGA